MSRLAELRRVQAVHLRLLYSEDFINEYRSDADAVFRKWGLPGHWRGLLPDPASDGFLAEVHGRRVMAAEDVYASYAATLSHLGCNSVRDLYRAPFFLTYLGSMEFFDHAHSLPDPTGVGRGYEGYSRFFFWFRRHFGITRTQQLAVRDELYLDFAAEVDSRKRGALDPYWDRFQHGMFWSQVPGAMSPCRGLSPRREVITRSTSYARRELMACGYVDLDEVEP